MSSVTPSPGTPSNCERLADAVGFRENATYSDVYGGGGAVVGLDCHLIPAEGRTVGHVGGVHAPSGKPVLLETFHAAQIDRNRRIQATAPQESVIWATHRWSTMGQWASLGFQASAAGSIAVVGTFLDQHLPS